MDYQQIISLGIVALSAILLIRRQIRKRRRAALRPCGHDCACSTDRTSTTDKITYSLAGKAAPKKDP